ncbi:hypothetical protein ACFL21_03190 [Patescibacteria group bacterium]
MPEETQNQNKQEIQEEQTTNETPQEAPPQKPEEDISLGPARVSIVTFLLKILAAGGGGVVGSLVLFLIFLLAQSALTPLSNIEDADQASAIFIFLLMIMVFLASTVGNILSTTLLGLTETEKYKRLSSSIYQVFIISIIIFVFMVPVYFLTSSINIEITTYAVALHIIISAQVSALILEIVSNYRYSLLGVYGVTFAIVISTGIMFAVTKLIDNISPAILLFSALPIVWGSIALVHTLVNNIYGWIARTYDKDFLSTQTLYGKDYGREVEETDEEIEEKPKTKDGAGADFLRKQD